MKRRKFIAWLAGAVAAIAIDPVLGGQAIWGTERPKLPKHVDVGVSHVPEPCLGPPGDRVWNAEALENLKAYHTLEEEQRLEQALMEGMAKTIAQDHERAVVMSDYDYDPPCQNLGLVHWRPFKDSHGWRHDSGAAVWSHNGQWRWHLEEGQTYLGERPSAVEAMQVVEALASLRRLEKAPAVQALSKRMALLEDTNAIVGGLDEDVDYHKKKLFQALGVSDPDPDLIHHDFAMAMGSALNDEIKKRLG